MSKKDNGGITLSEIRNELIKKYDLKDDEFFINTFDKKLMAICQKIYTTKDGKNLWEKSTIRKKGAKKNSHIFFPNDKEKIVNSPELREYLSKRTTNETLRQTMRDELEAENENEVYRKMIESGEMDEIQESLQKEPIIEFVLSEEFDQKLRDIMLEAIFLKFFTPINKTLLKSDMEMVRIVPFGEDTKETIQARRRLTDPKNYYKEIAKSVQPNKKQNQSIFKTSENKE